MLRRVLPTIVVCGMALATAEALGQDQSAILDRALALANAEAGFDPGAYPLDQVSAPRRWDGAYAGGFLAYTRSGLYDSLGPVGGIESFEGWMAGLDAGFDFTLAGGVIAGMAGDVAWSDIVAMDDLNGDVGRIGWSGSVRGRVGLDADNLLPYVTAGLAVAGAEFDSPDGLETVGGTHLGWTVGIGLEAAVNDQISIDLLYRYSDYGTVEYAYASPAPATIERGLTAQQISLGLNFSF